MRQIQKTISPVDGSIYVERPLATASDIERVLTAAIAAQRTWRNVLIAERKRIGHAFAGEFERRANDIALEISWQMGRPASAAPGEVRGTLERARYMIEAAPGALADLDV